MMRLGLMKRFFDTVDAQGASPLATAIAAPWVSPEAPVRVVRASANFVCRVEDSGKTYFLRFNHTSERQAPEIQAELDFIAHLAVRGIPAARPLPSRQGRLLESVTTGLDLFHAVLFEALPGIEREFAGLDLADLERWGQALGAVHCAGEGFVSTARPGWVERLELARQVIPLAETAAWRQIDMLAVELARLPQEPANFGMIHYDFEQDNLCWDRETLRSLDYDDCGPHWYAADIAHALRDLFHDRPAHIDLTEPRLRAFVRGYRAARPIEDAWLQRLPLFLRLHNLVSFARITRSLAEGPLSGEPAWMPALRQHLEGILDGYRRNW
jgi:Ser/Thr protein kinase RdoA (MazF antagonist)